ncbi:MAG: hypothetical protein ACRDDZ_02055 [Marinifilaceae bacterium]
MSFAGHVFDMFRRNKANLEQLQQHRRAMAARRYRMKCKKDEDDMYNNDNVIYIETVLRKKLYKEQLKRKRYTILIIVGMAVFLVTVIALLFILPMPQMR